MSASLALQPSADPADASALQAVEEIVQQALLSHQRGDLEIAETLYRTVLDVQPRHAEANYRLGRLAVQVDQAPAALAHFAQALTARPHIDRYWLAYADAMMLAGETDAARQLLALWREQVDQGPPAQGLTGQPDAPATTAQPLQAQPLESPLAPPPAVQAPPAPEPEPEPEPVSGGARPDTGQSAAARKTARKAQPSDQDIKRLMRLYNQGDLAQAQSLAAALTVRLPAHWLGWRVLGAVLVKRAQFAQALAAMQTAAQLAPEDAETHLNLGFVLKSLGRAAEAEASYRRALQVAPGYVNGHRKLGELLGDEGRLAEAEASYRRALQLQPDCAETHMCLSTTLHAQGRLQEAEASCRQALQHQPGSATLYSNWLFFLTLGQALDPAALFAEHCRFGERFEAPLRRLWRGHANPREPQRVLQIGFVSADLRQHAVFSFLEPLLAPLAGSAGLTLHAYSNWTAEDEATERLRPHFRHWHRVVDLGDAALADKIRADGIDILIDLSGHTGFNRLPVFAHKPAPLQVSWMGYPGTTGLGGMDYYLSDPFLLTPGRFDDQFTEKLVYLPANAPFTALVHLAPVNELPALRNGYVTFGSFNRPDKISRAVVELWSQLLLALPTSCMVLGGMPNDAHELLIGWFADAGVARERLSFNRRAGMSEYLALHHQVDLCLDTFPYNGGTTTLHALSMGVPTLTLAGDTLAGRVGAGILGHVGLEPFVARDAADFIGRGLACAGDLPGLASLRAGLRERFAQSAMGQPALIAAGLARALRIMWQRWCAGLPAQSFIVDRNDIDPLTHDNDNNKEPA